MVTPPCVGDNKFTVGHVFVCYNVEAVGCAMTPGDHRPSAYGALASVPAPLGVKPQLATPIDVRSDAELAHALQRCSAVLGTAPTVMSAVRGGAALLESAAPKKLLAAATSIHPSIRPPIYLLVRQRHDEERVTLGPNSSCICAQPATESEPASPKIDH
jgi:hypothetical protein